MSSIEHQLLAPSSLAIGLTTAGILVSEWERQPRQPIAGILLCSVLLGMVLGGFHWRQNEDGSFSKITTFVCFLTMGFGWFLRLAAMQALGTAFNLRFDESGARHTNGGKVVSTGPYSVIRHPGYLSFLLCFSPMAYIVSNHNPYYALTISGLLLGIFGYVIVNFEEKRLLETMSREYKQYIKEVPYRLFPFIY
jgi:protein-S-isoprenylcysteine O-methyltransferase Ste14